MSEIAFIRPAISLDSECLSGIAFRSKAHWGYTSDFMESCRAELSVSVADIENHLNQYFVAEIDALIIGFCSVSQTPENEYELDSMFVEPDYIGKGIGKLLIAHAKSYAKSLGAKSMLIQSDPNASAFYRAMGAELVGERESGSIPGRFLPEFRISI